MEGACQPPAASLARPQLDPNAFANELQGIGAFIIELRLEKPRFHHLDKKALDPYDSHGADVERQGIVPIANARFLHLGSRISMLCGGGVGIVPFYESVPRAVVAINIIVPADDRGIDETLDEIRIL